MARPMPGRAALAAQTDQLLAQIADERGKLSGAEGNLTAQAADKTARLLAQEFSGVPELGRILVSLSTGLISLTRVLDRRGVEVDIESLLTVVGLAGEQLDREAREEAAGDGG
jgi:hypothetical protein